MHAAGWAGGIDQAGGQCVHQVYGGRHDQAGGDGGPDRGSRQLECGEQHRGEKIVKNGHKQHSGGDTKLDLKFFLADRFWITLQEAPGCMLKVTSPYVWSCPHYIQN